VTTTRAERHHEPDYTMAVDSLAARFDGVFTRDEVVAAVEQARREVEPSSRIHDFLELLVERRALEALRARAAGRSEAPA
jgi:hypothetical protein